MPPVQNQAPTLQNRINRLRALRARCHWLRQGMVRRVLLIPCGPDRARLPAFTPRSALPLTERGEGGRRPDEGEGVRFHRSRTVRQCPWVDLPSPSKIRNRFARLRALHSDQRGAISVLSVFTLLLFTMLLMMVFNVAKQHDDKLRMQNAADAATYSGGVVLARGMNAIAFSNHLEADVFALTAFLREARDRNAASYVPEVLSAWVAAGGKFNGATFPKFQGLDGAIARKTPLEQQFVTAWSDMAAAAAQNMLPVFEYILGTPESQAPGARDHLIPEFQRTLVQMVPSLAQEMTLEIALRHGLRQQDLDRLGTNLRYSPNSQSGDRGPQVGVLWTTSVEPVGYDAEFDPQTRTLPVVDPEPYRGRLPIHSQRRPISGARPRAP